MKINSVLIHETNFVALLGMSVNNNLKFRELTENVCCQANFKLHALCNMRKYQQKRLDIIQAFLFLVQLFIDQSSEYFAMKPVSIK